LGDDLREIKSKYKYISPVQTQQLQGLMGHVQPN
jgi:hypothetical protein